MTIAVDLGPKATKQTKSYVVHFELALIFMRVSDVSVVVHSLHVPDNTLTWRRMLCCHRNSQSQKVHHC